MIEPKLEVPTELRDLAEKTIDQAEKAFGMFFDAANKSIASIPSPGTEMSKQALSLTEQNIKASFEHARKLVHATDLQEAHAHPIGVPEEPVYQCRRTYAPDHWRGHVRCEGRDERQILIVARRPPARRGSIIPCHEIVLHEFAS